MTDTVTLKPAEGRRVRDPATGEPLGEAGAAVVLTPYWRRRLDDSDVVEVTPKGKEKA